MTNISSSYFLGVKKKKVIKKWTFPLNMVLKCIDCIMRYLVDFWIPVQLQLYINYLNRQLFQWNSCANSSKLISISAAQNATENKILAISFAQHFSSQAPQKAEPLELRQNGFLMYRKWCFHTFLQISTFLVLAHALRVLISYGSALRRYATRKRTDTIEKRLQSHYYYGAV